MNKLIVFFIVGILSACGSSEGEDQAKESVKAETSEKLQKVQETNVELEEIDGELDSLINILK